MARFAVTLVMLAALLSWSRCAYAQNDAMQGVWRQVKSNAGECRTCQVSLERRDDGLAVTANNGWSASVRPEPDELHLASGGGRWRPGDTNPHSGKFFRVHFASTNTRLYMVMLGQGFRIEAEFERKPSDSI